MPMFVDPQRARFGMLATRRRMREDLFEYDKYEDVLRFVARGMLREAQSREADALRALNKSKVKRAIAISRLYFLGKNRGKWDYKPKIIDKVSSPLILQNFGSLRAGTTFWSTPIRGDRKFLYFYDIWSNVLFGYVAKSSGFSVDEALLGSRLHDIASGLDLTESINDSVSVGVGAALFDRVGFSLNAASLHTTMFSTRSVWTRPPVKVTPRDIGYEPNPIEV